MHRVPGSRLEPGQIRLGKRALDVVPDADGYRVLFEDNSEHYTKYLIVADGIHSPIRKKMLPQNRIRYSGYTCWRGIADNRRLQVRESSETWGLKGRFSFGNLVLVGDAAHATAPNLGQGACQAIEDAVMLAADLKSHSMVADAFRSFEKKR